MALVVGFLSLIAEELWLVLPASPYFSSISSFCVIVSCIFFGGAIAFAMVWAEFSVIQETSALTFMVAGTFKEIVTGQSLPDEFWYNNVTLTTNILVLRKDFYMLYELPLEHASLALNCMPFWRDDMHMHSFEKHLLPCSYLGCYLPGRRFWFCQCNRFSCAGVWSRSFQLF